ncbi:hypothetical protein PTRA_a0475 [Pseudoalteromonas translucida KMM 520]|uniref:HTH tetR-type domain-containing protein n=1 Tax=Pseudoalteromonas translucida KMM 520 TaxID=1315283 RepID=A0A0U2VE80_9GAMM|nr:TetR/AcrR family transcriptional regulator [Pseudoalteromonas translucida]ALS31829.1 hypothetical protein PTRA_a0475 [Pseudoalteromonas translucida KMM 520]
MAITNEKPSKSNKLTAKDWLNMAECELSKFGISAVKVEPLAKKLKVTKGSFYWHFSGREELFEQLLTSWRVRSTNAIIERLSDANFTAKEQLRELFFLPHKNIKSINGGALELAIRNWSQHDENVKETINEVDNHRLKFISDNFKSLGSDQEEAEIKAYRFYYTMQGYKVVGINMDGCHLEKVFNTLL